jgi:hypothetical protein
MAARPVHQIFGLQTAGIDDPTESATRIKRGRARSEDAEATIQPSPTAPPSLRAVRQLPQTLVRIGAAPTPSPHRPVAVLLLLLGISGASLWLIAQRAHFSLVHNRAPAAHMVRP